MTNPQNAKFIPTSEPVLDGNEKKYVIDSLNRNWISANGPYTKKLEENFAKWVGTKYAVSCSNGTTAIHLAIAALGLKPGDEIIIPDFTIICSASMPILAGLKPVLVDVDKYWCIDPIKIEEKITKKTKAIMPVHMYGNPANIPAILKIANKHNLLVIEDACAAHGATVGDKRVGSMGNVGCFSFYASKNMTAGEGGMVVTNNKEVYEMAKLLRSHGFETPRFIHRFLGFNYRMTDLQAAVAVAQLENIDKKVKKRREIAEYYRKLLSDVKEISFTEDPSWGKSTFWMFGILIGESFGRNRDEVIEKMGEMGVGTERFYTSMSKQPIFIKGGDERYPDVKGDYRISQDIAVRGLYLPSGLSITKTQQIEVVEKLKSLIVKSSTLFRPTFKRKDERGMFTEILNGGEWKNVSYGEMKQGAVMGNHYHQETKVFFCITRGSVKIDVIDVKNKKTETFTLKKSECVVFKPFYSHAIRFIENSEFIMGKDIAYNLSNPDTYPFEVPNV